MIPVGIYAFGIAFVMPAMSTAALAPFGRAAGAAASMLGFVQMGSGLLMGSLGALIGNAVIAMAVLIPIMGAAACSAYVLFRHTAPAPLAPVTTGAGTAPAGAPLMPRPSPANAPDR